MLRLTALAVLTVALAGCAGSGTPGPPIGGCSAATIGMGSTFGALDGADCRFQGSFADAYRFEVTEAGTFQLNLTSRDFPVRISLYDASGDELAEGARGDAVALRRALDVGTYTVVVSSRDSEARGAYTLEIEILS